MAVVIDFPYICFPFSKLVFNSNIWPKLARLRDTRLRNLSNLDTDLSRSLKSTVIASMKSPYRFLINV